MTKRRSSRPHTMDFIADTSVFRAVMWAKEMMDHRARHTTAVQIAAEYYSVDEVDVAYYLGQLRSPRNR